MSQAWIHVFPNPRHNAEHVDVVISGPGQPQENNIFMFSGFSCFHTKIALWALQRSRGDILHLVKTVEFEQKTSNSCLSTIQSPRVLPMEDPAPSGMSSSLSVAKKRGSRDKNFPEPIILGNVISSTHLSNDSSSWKANKQAKFNMQSFTDCVLVSWLVLSNQVHVHVIALSIIY